MSIELSIFGNKLKWNGWDPYYIYMILFKYHDSFRLPTLKILKRDEAILK